MNFSFTKDPYFKVLKKKKIGVLMGGRSAEREVSLRSGRGVISALKRLGFDAVALDPSTSLEKKIAKAGVEVAFLAVHGRWGEDGTLQGFLEYSGIPYTGSGVHASALAMNKITSKRVFKDASIPTAPYFPIHAVKGFEDRLPSLKFPLLIKPINEGSSVGCHLVKSKAELIRAVKKEGDTYPRLMAEKYISGKELTVGVIDMGQGVEPLPILELAPKNAFYDYKAKYTEGVTDFILPARLSASMTAKIMEYAVRAHEALNCHGYSRTDFILDSATNTPYCLETNTLPGLTALSDIPAQAREAGITYDELIYWILRSALSAKRSLKRSVYDD
ncbi:MAG: D-alanine--D-alanine ligase [Fibrobacteres bacterium]|nr:D-alanine--D-alanine ligase [Fibrobacterota bacterium]